MRHKNCCSNGYYTALGLHKNTAAGLYLFCPLLNHGALHKLQVKVLTVEKVLSRAMYFFLRMESAPRLLLSMHFQTISQKKKCTWCCTLRSHPHARRKTFHNPQTVCINTVEMSALMQHFESMPPVN